MTTRYLETPRLILRDWQDSDLLPFTEMNADPKVMEYFVKPLTAEESSAFFLRIRNELADFGYGAYAVERKRTESSLALPASTGFRSKRTSLRESRSPGG